MAMFGGFFDKFFAKKSKDASSSQAKAATADSVSVVHNDSLKSAQIPKEKNAQSVQTIRSWYQERYESALIQRNIVLFLAIILLLLSIVSVGAIGYIVSVREFDPFVIQVDETSGMAQVVNPANSQVIDGNEALAKYFIRRYIVARETYNSVDFDTRAKQTVRLLSANSIYWNYRNLLRKEEFNPSIIYGQKNSTFLKIKSWSAIAKKSFLVRFAIHETSGAQKIFNKIAVVEYDYMPMELSEEEFDINPVGFQVQGYRVDDDDS